jgi:hypothetical protein
MAVKASLVDRLAEKAKLESLLDTATPSSIHPISLWTLIMLGPNKTKPINLQCLQLLFVIRPYVAHGTFSHALHQPQLHALRFPQKLVVLVFWLKVVVALVLVNV